MQLSHQFAPAGNARTGLLSDAHERVMRRFIEEVVSNGDFSVLDDVVHPNYVYRAPGEELHGPEELKALFAAYHTAFPDLSLEIDDLMVTGDKAVTSFTLTGTHEGMLLGMAATGRKVQVNGMVLSRFEDGKIVEEWEILDQLTMFQQLGTISFTA